MTGGESKIDLEKAQLDPDSLFSSLEELRDPPGLTREKKLEILRSWAYEACKIAVAEEEGMVSGEPLHLAEILSVLHDLTSGYDVEHSPPTKQKGV